MKKKRYLLAAVVVALFAACLYGGCGRAEVEAPGAERIPGGCGGDVRSGVGLLCHHNGDRLARA